MSPYLDGLLSAEQALPLQVHLADCEACAEEWEAMCWLSSWLKAEPMASPAPDFTTQVVRRLQQRETRRRLYSSLGVCMGSMGLWALAGAVLLLLFIALWHPLIRVALLDVGLSLAKDVLSILAVLGKALCLVVYALAARPTSLLLLGYAILALGLTALWAHVVFQRWRHVLQF